MRSRIEILKMSKRWIKIQKICGGPAAIRTQDLTVISRALHQAKLRAQMAGFLELSKLKAFLGKHPNPTTLLILNLLLIVFA